MADEEHLRILREGVDRWNQWREDNPEVEPELRYADLRYADFSYADFSYADLSNADLSNAFLRNAHFCNATLRDADLSYANLGNVNFSNADLRDANFSNADLSYANISTADLRDANLLSIQALGASFQKAELTGACVENWHINVETELDNVVCEYVFLRRENQERRPSDTNKIFAPGDFAKLVQKSLETVDLIFSNGIDWKAFALSLGDLRVEYAEQELSIQAIENKNDAFVIRLSVPPDTDSDVLDLWI